MSRERVRAEAVRDAADPAAVAEVERCVRAYVAGDESIVIGLWSLAVLMTEYDRRGAAPASGDAAPPARRPAADGFCCTQMWARSTLDCDTHRQPGDCPDVLVLHSKQHGPGLPIRDGGGSFLSILFCPWCGTDLAARSPRPETAPDDEPASLTPTTAALIKDGERLRQERAELLAEVEQLRAALAARTPQPAEPNYLDDGVEVWIVPSSAGGLVVRRDATSRLEPTEYRIDDHEIDRAALRRLRDVLTAALTEET